MDSRIRNKKCCLTIVTRMRHSPGVLLPEPAAIGQFDLGAISYAICLAAWERGLGTVINGQGVMQTPVVREHANIPDDQNILTCIAMDYPNEEFSANGVKSRRANLEDFVSFVGFD